MLVLLFQVDNDFYALQGSRVVEVIPKVNLRKLHHVPEYAAGLFNYRGQIVPVVDICCLLRGTSSRYSFNTRIIMVDYGEIRQNRKYVGLIAEKVTETLHKTDSDFVDSGINIKEAPYLGKILVNEKGMIHYIELDKLLANAEGTYLLMDKLTEAKDDDVSTN
jgi:chemotaxis-related protein WspB